MNIFRHFANIFNFFAPTSHFFNVKRILYRLGGINVGVSVKINGRTWFYGNGDVIIGDRTWIGPDCHFHATTGTSIAIGSDCDIAPDVLFITGTHVVGAASRRAGLGYGQNIKVGDGCWIGARVTILPNIDIGKSSVIGSGAVVTTTIQSNVLAVGVPAHVLRYL